MCDSRAKWFAVAASARYEPWRSGESAGWNSIALVRDRVGARDRRRARSCSCELPGGERAVAAAPAPDVDHRRGAEVRPRELLLAGPAHLHRLRRPLRPAAPPRSRPRRCACRRSRRPGVRHDHADLRFGDAEGRGQLRAHAERALRPGPHGEPVAVPLRERRARLERHVRDVRDRVGRARAGRRRRRARGPRRLPSCRNGPSQPSASPGWVRRCSTRSVSDGCGVAGPTRPIAASASAAAAGSGATTPTNEPSRTIMTPGRPPPPARRATRGSRRRRAAAGSAHAADPGA